MLRIVPRLGSRWARLLIGARHGASAASAPSVGSASASPALDQKPNETTDPESKPVPQEDRHAPACKLGRWFAPRSLSDDDDMAGEASKLKTTPGGDWGDGSGGGSGSGGGAPGGGRGGRGRPARSVLTDLEVGRLPQGRSPLEVIPWESIEDNMPYEVEYDRCMQSVLLCAQVALAPPQYNVHETLSSRTSQVLLRGDYGTEVIHEAMARHVARRMRRPLVVVDPSVSFADRLDAVAMQDDGDDEAGEEGERDAEADHEASDREDDEERPRAKSRVSLVSVELPRGERGELGADGAGSESDGDGPSNDVRDILFRLLDQVAQHAPCVVFVRELNLLVPALGFSGSVAELLSSGINFPHLLMVSHTVPPASLASAEDQSPSPMFSSVVRNLLSGSSGDGNTSAREEYLAQELVRVFPTSFWTGPPSAEKAGTWYAALPAQRAAYVHERNMTRLRLAASTGGLALPSDPLQLPWSNLIPFDVASRVVALALGYDLQHQRLPVPLPMIDFGDAPACLSREALRVAVDLIHKQMSRPATAALRGPVLLERSDLNRYEQKIAQNVISPGDIDVGFSSIGALTPIKQTLRELVMLPLRRPELFLRGQLRRSVTGILLFGPPGTGKTMLAKAVAAESGAAFINVSMSELTSKWFGDGEKLVRALFSLANKIAPSIIFVDEIDSFLSSRWMQGEHEATRRMKNEFLALWDGLASRGAQRRVIVLGATNRPMDLDDAVLRRMPRRLLVDVPTRADRLSILQTVLKDEVLEPGFDMEKLADATRGMTGSDLRDLAIAAAYQPIREHLAQFGEAIAQERPGEARPPVTLRPLTYADFVRAMDEVKPSVNEESLSVTELRRWNEMYGRGGRGTRVKYGFGGLDEHSGRPPA